VNNLQVKDVMTSNVSVVEENSSISEVASKMKSLNVGSIPVCDSGGKPLGMITDRDIVIRNVSEGSGYDISIGSIMTPNVITVTPDTGIHEAARIMAQNQIRRLPVVENNKMVGILSIGDLAVRDIYINEAGDALSNISIPSRPEM